jgi:hypothetical protein
MSMRAAPKQQQMSCRPKLKVNELKRMPMPKMKQLKKKKKKKKKKERFFFFES